MGRWPCVLWILVAACGDGGGVGSSGSSGTGGNADDSGLPRCSDDIDCFDGLYCNGIETCDPTHADADDLGCVAGVVERCDDDVACTVDECLESIGACMHTAADVDNDGHADIACRNTNGDWLGDDCDDNDSDRFPGNPEDCDDHDEDCDELTIGALDSDGDGMISDACCNRSGDRMQCGSDCDDGSVAKNYRQVEFCDGVDNDCDSRVDEAAASVAWYPDADGDNFGSATARAVRSCIPIATFSLLNTDCDDGDATRHPGQLDICDTVENNCNAVIDENGGPNCATTQPDAAIPINECANGLYNCGEGIACLDLPIGYSCVNGDPCRTNNGGCDTAPIATCNFGNGVVRCACPDATTGTGIGAQGCVTQVDECATNNGGCGDPSAVLCADSQPMAPRTCTDVNECGNGSHNCTTSQVCVNTPGSFVCVADRACAQNDYNIVDQAGVTALANENCTFIRGHLALSSPMVTSLSGLGFIRSIGTFLNITNTAVTTLEGLDAVLRVEQDVLVTGNNNLTDIGFRSLTTVGGALGISSNLALPDLDGLQQLVRVESGVAIASNDILRTTAALTKLQYVGFPGLAVSANGLTTVSFPALVETAGLGVNYNSDLTTLAGLSSLRRIDGDFDVTNGGNLQAITSLNNVESITGDVEIASNGELLNLNAINIGQIGGSLSIHDNAKLATIGGFPTLRATGTDLDIRHNPRLTSINGFTSLTSVGGHFAIDYNRALTGVGGFGALTEINGDLGIEGNLVLSDITGMRAGSLRSLGNRLMIRLNPALSVCQVNALRDAIVSWNRTDLSAGNQGCASCTAAQCTGTAGGTDGQSTVYGSAQTPATFDVTTDAPLQLLVNITEITGNLIVWSSLVTNLTPLSRLNRVRGDLTLFDNESLANINGLMALTEVGGTLSIEGNDLLGSLGGGNVGLIQLASVGALQVVGNPSLTNLNGLSALAVIAGNLTVRDNPALSECAPDALRDQLAGWSGAYTSSGNLVCAAMCSGSICP